MIVVRGPNVAVRTKVARSFQRATEVPSVARLDVEAGFETARVVTSARAKRDGNRNASTGAVVARGVVLFQPPAVAQVDVGRVERSLAHRAKLGFGKTVVAQSARTTERGGDFDVHDAHSAVR